MIISGSSANRIRLAQQRRVEINRCNSSTVRTKTSTACHTKCPAGRLYRAHFSGFMANEAREVVSVESNNLLVYFFWSISVAQETTSPDADSVRSSRESGAEGLWCQFIHWHKLVDLLDLAGSVRRRGSTKKEK